MLAVATFSSAALSYGFSRLSGALDERVTFPVGTPAALLGLALTLWAPRRFGWRWGRTGRDLGAVAGWAVLVVAAVAGYRMLAGAAPYAPTFAEVVVVPVGEEALFRGFLLTALWSWLGHRLSTASAAVTARCAVAVSAVAFGIAHLGNLGHVPTGFVLVQALAAVLLGVLAGWLRIRTDSLVGPVVVHAAMNAAAVL